MDSLFCCAGRRDKCQEEVVYPDDSTDSTVDASKSWYKPDAHNLSSMNTFTSNAPFMEDYDTLKRVHTSKDGHTMLELCEQRSTGERWMVKIINKGLAKKAFRRTLSRTTKGPNVENEVVVLERLNDGHPNVVGTSQVLEDEVNQMLYIVMDFVEGGPAMRWNAFNIRYDATEDHKACYGLDRHTARAYFADAVAGLQHLHKIQVVHRDLKPEVSVTQNGCALSFLRVLCVSTEPR